MGEADGMPDIERAYVDINWGGCRFTDESSVEEVQALAGQKFFYCDESGTAGSIRLVEGEAPWPGHPTPRPVYRIRWYPDA